MIQIGNKSYKYKKDALNHYKSILNSYKFGDSLNESDFNDLFDLLDYDSSFYNDENFNINESIDNQENRKIIGIKIAKVQFNTKCLQN